MESYCAMSSVIVLVASCVAVLLVHLSNNKPTTVVCTSYFKSIPTVH